MMTLTAETLRREDFTAKPANYDVEPWRSPANHVDKTAVALWPMDGPSAPSSSGRKPCHSQYAEQSETQRHDRKVVKIVRVVKLAATANRRASPNASAETKQSPLPENANAAASLFALTKLYANTLTKQLEHLKYLKTVSSEAEPEFAPMRVEWELAMIDDGTGHKIPNTRPGAEGHVGIAGLCQGGEGKMHSIRRKSMRQALAEASTISPTPVPHDIPEEQLREAAYFLSQKSELAEMGQDAHWVGAIRQIRRARVRELAESAQRRGLKNGQDE